jgi:hypothetical protein
MRHRNSRCPTFFRPSAQCEVGEPRTPPPWIRPVPRPDLWDVPRATGDRVATRRACPPHVAFCDEPSVLDDEWSLFPMSCQGVGSVPAPSSLPMVVSHQRSVTPEAPHNSNEQEVASRKRQMVSLGATAQPIPRLRLRPSGRHSSMSGILRLPLGYQKGRFAEGEATWMKGVMGARM